MDEFLSSHQTSRRKLVTEVKLTLFYQTLHYQRKNLWNNQFGCQDFEGTVTKCPEFIINNCLGIGTNCLNLIFFCYDSDVCDMSRMSTILDISMQKQSTFYYPIVRQASLQGFFCLHCKNFVPLQLTSRKQNKVLPVLSFHSNLVLQQPLRINY